MGYEDILRLLKNISENWLFLAIFSGCVLVLLAIKPTRPFGACLAFSNVLLIVRKILLFIPVMGSISDYDHIVFWDVTSYYIYSIGMPAAIIVAMLIVRKIRNSDNPRAALAAIGCLTPIVVIIGLIASAALFGIILEILFAYVFGIIKLVMINPILLPLSFLLPLFLFLFVAKHRNFSANRVRITSAAIALILVFASLLHIGSQANLLFTGVDSAWRSALEGVRDGWVAESGVFPNEEIDKVLKVWWKKLPEIRDSGINTVERSVPMDFSFQESALLTQRFDVCGSLIGRLKRTVFEWSTARITWILFAGAIFLILMAGTSIRVSFRNREREARAKGRSPNGAL